MSCNWQKMLLMRFTTLRHKEMLKYSACWFSRVTPSTRIRQKSVFACLLKIKLVILVKVFLLWNLLHLLLW